MQHDITHYKGRPCELSDLRLEIERWEQWHVELNGDNAGQPTQVITDDPTATYYRCSDCLQTFATWEKAVEHLPAQATVGEGVRV